MTKYPFSLGTPNLAKFLENHIPNAEVPKKIDRNYLKSIGYKSSYDLAIISVLKSISFLDKNSVPTQEYSNFSDKDRAPFVMGKAIKGAYSELFKRFSNADKEEAANLQNFFKVATGFETKKIKAMISTFQTLCNFANFDDNETFIEEHQEETPKGTLDTSRALGLHSLNINLQITLPETTDNRIYEEIFKAMKVYLLDNN